MSKKDISKIIKTGSIKQRLSLLAEDTARGKLNLPSILTEQEHFVINDSITKPNEIKLYNKYKLTDECVTQALINLQGLSYEVRMHYSNLRGYLFVWSTIEGAEGIINNILHEIKDPKERLRLAKLGAKEYMLFVNILPDEEGYLELNIEKQKINLLELMNNVKKETINSIIRFISWRQALVDYMEERDFNVPTYIEQLDNLTNVIYSPIIGIEKYEGSKDNLAATNSRLDKLKEKYFVTPNMDELEVDINIYNWFKSEFLINE